jgi:histidine triad (HIT) family protein
MDNNVSCIFCDICDICNIVEAKSPCHKIWEDDKHLAFLSIFSNTTRFTVVIPKQHHSSYAFDQDDAVLCELVIATKKVANLLDKALDGVARSGIFFKGYGVEPLHIKLAPMHKTGEGSGFKSIESKQDKFFERYEGYLSSHDHNRANDNELSNLAALIRSYG